MHSSGRVENEHDRVLSRSVEKCRVISRKKNDHLARTSGSNRILDLAGIRILFTFCLWFRSTIVVTTSIWKVLKLLCLQSLFGVRWTQANRACFQVSEPGCSGRTMLTFGGSVGNKASEEDEGECQMATCTQWQKWMENSPAYSRSLPKPGCQ
jgi:hypothetical protein